MLGNRFSNIMVAAMALFLAAGAAPWPAAAQDMRELTASFGRMRALSSAGNYDAALAEAERFEAAVKAQFGVNHPHYVAALNALAICYGNLGRYADSEALFRQVLALREKGRDTDSIAESLNNLAVVFAKEGKYGPAEDLYKRALALEEKHPNRTDAYGISDFSNTLGSLAMFYRRQGRYADAEGLYLRVLAITQKTLGANHHDVAVALDDLALLYVDQGRYSEAEALASRALAIKQQKDISKNPLGAAASQIVLAQVYRGQGKYAEAEELFKAALSFQEQLYGSNHPYVAETLGDLALVDQALRRYDEAEQLLPRALAIHRQVEGPSHPATAKTLNQLAVLSALTGKTAQALSYSRQATAAVIALAGSASSEAQQNTASLNLIEQRASFFRTHVANLAGAAASGIEPQAALGREAFEIAQWAIQSTAGAAVQQMGARFAAGDGALAALVRQSQDLSALWRDRDKALVEALARPQGQRNQAMIDNTRRQIADTETRLAEITARLQRDFPGYAALANPKPLNVANTEMLLGADEALVFFLTDDTKSYAFALTRDAFDWKTIPIGGAALQQKIAAFRRGLNPDTLSQQIEAAKSTGKPPDMFDLGLANAVYAALLGPVETLIKDKKQLLIVPSGSLTALPFNLLVTDKPSGAASLASPASYRDAAWLIKRQAVTVIPSVVSLNALRAFARKDVAGKPMVGFGDPAFDPNVPAGNIQLAARNLTTRSYTDFFAGAGVDRAKLAQALPALPDTADELKAVAKDLGALPSDIHLGKDASETTVKRLPLADYRIIYFATHGLVAGDIKGLAEPSLALSIPAQPSDLDDGLLTASEVAQLKLNADWVVLSACNTIAGDKPGAEALSGLARAFFYAGARALLVSHWAVDSNAATRLTTSTFDLLKSDSSLGRAEALRRAELAYLSDPSDPMNSYPAFWAPFEIVGEGAAR